MSNLSEYIEKVREYILQNNFNEIEAFFSITILYIWGQFASSYNSILVVQLIPNSYKFCRKGRIYFKQYRYTWK